MRGHGSNASFPRLRFMAKCISTHLSDEGEVRKLEKQEFGYIAGKWPTPFLESQNRDWILRNDFELLVYWSLQNIWATFGRPIAGVSCPRAERRPQRATTTHRYGATWPMECTFSAATTAAAASVSTASVTTDRAGALHGSRWGGSDLNDLHFFDRQAQGGWNLLEVFFGRIPREVWWGLMIWHKSFG